MTKSLWILLVILQVGSPHIVCAEAPATLDFTASATSAAKIGTHLTKETSGRTQLETVDGSQVLALTNTAVQFQSVSVHPSTKYTLTFEAAFEGDVESIEDNPRFDAFTRPGNTSRVLPSREIRFLDSTGKAVGPPLRSSLPFKRRHVYTDVFYTPPSAMSLQLGIATGAGVRLLVTSARLRPTADEGALNANPTFQLGPFNYSGWQNIAAGGLLIERDGKTILDTKYGSTSSLFPLPGPGTYAVSAIAKENGFNSTVHLRVYDAQGKQLMETRTGRVGKPTYFVPPKEAVAASFLVYSSLLEELRLVRVGDESAIESLRAK